jgi:membrane fusion protein (multidrug efflux system)
MSDTSASGDPDDATSEAPGRRWPKRLLVVGAVLLIVLGLALPKLWGKKESGGGGGPSSSAPMSVDATVLQPGTIAERLRTTGTLRADEAVALTPEAAGKITDIRFEEGARVQKGQLLVQINDAELQAERRRIEHELTLAADRAERQKRLLEEGGVSQEEYDATVNEVEVLRAELDGVTARIDKTQIRAPFTGVVGLRRVSEGAYVTPEVQITTLNRLDPIKVDFSVPEKYASRVQVGQSISFRVRGIDRERTGQVYATDVAVTDETRTLQLRARTDNPDRVLRPGMFADVEVTLGIIDEAITVPAFAVTPTLDGQRVFVVKNGTAQPRNITLGIRTDSTVQVTDGLALGDTVITSGIQELRAGLPVRIEKIEGRESNTREAQ